MGFGGISIWQLLIVLAIVLLLFGTKRLRNLGGDLGGAIKGFKKSMTDEDSKPNEEKGQESQSPDLLGKNATQSSQQQAQQKPQQKHPAGQDKPSQDK